MDQALSSSSFTRSIPGPSVAGVESRSSRLASPLSLLHVRSQTSCVSELELCVSQFSVQAS